MFVTATERKRNEIIAQFGLYLFGFCSTVYWTESFIYVRPALHHWVMVPALAFNTIRAVIRTHIFQSIGCYTFPNVLLPPSQPSQETRNGSSWEGRVWPSWLPLSFLAPVHAKIWVEKMEEKTGKEKEEFLQSTDGLLVLKFGYREESHRTKLNFSWGINLHVLDGFRNTESN